MIQGIIDCDNYLDTLESYKNIIESKMIKGKIDKQKAFMLCVKLVQWHEQSAQSLQLTSKGVIRMGHYDNDVESMVKEFIEALTNIENVSMSSFLKGKKLKMDDDMIEELADEIAMEFDVDITDADVEEWKKVIDVVNFVKEQVE